VKNIETFEEKKKVFVCEQGFEGKLLRGRCNGKWKKRRGVDFRVRRSYQKPM